MVHVSLSTLLSGLSSLLLGFISLSNHSRNSLERFPTQRHSNRWVQLRLSVWLFSAAACYKVGETCASIVTATSNSYISLKMALSILPVWSMSQVVKKAMLFAGIASIYCYAAHLIRSAQGLSYMIASALLPIKIY